MTKIFYSEVVEPVDVHERLDTFDLHSLALIAWGLVALLGLAWTARKWRLKRAKERLYEIARKSE